MKKRTAFAALLTAFLMMFSSSGFALTVAESIDYIYSWSDDQRNYVLEETSYRGYELTARFDEIAENEFRLSVIMFMPPDYTVNDSVIKYHLYVNDTTEVIGAYVASLDLAEGYYDIFYGTAHYEGAIESLRIVPQWGKLPDDLLSEDAMEFSF